MKYALLFKQTEDIVEYTISVLRHIAGVYGHTFTDPEDADIIAVSVCDLSQISFVEGIRKKYPTKKIAIGGHASIYFKLWGLFADYVNIGQGFEFFKCKTIEQIEALPCVWTRDKQPPFVSSAKIDWSIVPVANVTNKQRYYWGAVGCKNKCQFCVTSWTNPHQQNDERVIKSVLKKYPNCTIVTNDSDEVASRMTQSIMLVDFLTKPLKKYGVYRIGIEFATEETRKKYGKRFSDAQFVEAINRAVSHGVRLKLFNIGGINTFQEWNDFYEQLPPIYQKGSFEVKFTNLTYDMFTPIKHERMQVDPSRMFDSTRVHSFVNGVKSCRWPFKSMPCASPRVTLLRNAIAYVTTMDEYNLYRALKPEKVSIDKVLSSLLNVFFINDYSGEVKINHKLTDTTGITPELVEDN